METWKFTSKFNFYATESHDQNVSYLNLYCKFWISIVTVDNFCWLNNKKYKAWWYNIVLIPYNHIALISKNCSDHISQFQFLKILPDNFQTLFKFDSSSWFIFFCQQSFLKSIINTKLNILQIIAISVQHCLYEYNYKKSIDWMFSSTSIFLFL